jgi:YggT family protein
VFVIGNFIDALAWLVDWIIQAYIWILIARAILTWVSPDPRNPIVQFLYRVTEPVLRPIRRRLPTYQMGLDLSPLIVILALIFVQRFLVRSLYGLAAGLG